MKGLTFVPKEEPSEEAKIKLHKTIEDRDSRLAKTVNDYRKELYPLTPDESCKSLEQNIKEFKNRFKISIEVNRDTEENIIASLPNIVVGKHKEAGIEIRIKTYRGQDIIRDQVQRAFDLIFDETYR